MANADKFLEEIEKQKKKKKKRGEDTSALEPIAPTKSDITGDDKVNAFFTALEQEQEKQREQNTYTDIAPVKTTVGTTDRVHGGRGGSFTVKSEEDDSLLDFFQKGAFSDGYQFGDVSKTILGTVGDLGVNAVKGVMKMGEGLGDAGQYLTAKAADAFGADEWADKVRKNAQRTVIDNAFAPVDKYLDRYSVFGRTLDAAGEAVGQIGGIIATGGLAAAAGAGTLGATAATTGVMGLSSFGTSTGEAYKGGAETGEAELFGAIAGTADAVSELIFGGLGKAVGAVGLSKGLSSADDILAKKVTEKITNTIAKNAVQLGIKAGAEGTEEVLAGLAQAAGKKLTYMSEEEIGQIIADENLLEQFVVGAMASGVAQVPSFVQANKTDTDFITGRTKNEQAVIDRVVEQRVKDAETDGKKLKAKERQTIEEEAAADMERGRIDIETIEEVLGGEDYQTYQSVVKNEDALRREYEELGALKEPTLAEKTRFDELHAKKAEIFSDERRTALKSKVSERVSQMAGQDRLAASFAERARRGEYFTEDASKYKSEAAKKTVQNLVDSKLANNTGRTHDMAETVAKIAEDKGIVFNFTNNQKLRESGKTAGVAENAIINGYKDAEGITVNLDSPMAWQFIVGHEVTHTLEGTAEYTELAQAVKVYAQTKGEYDSRRAGIASLYAEGTDVDSELTSDMIGEYIFTDEQFVTELSTKHQNVFQKVFAEIKHLLKMVTAGSKEARQLERVKHTFEKAYRAQQQAAKAAQTQHSLAVVDVIEPKSEGWHRTATTEEAKAAYPKLWDVSAEESDSRNPTQIKNTVNTYRKIYDHLKAEGFDGTILDASSGLGFGTKAGIEEYGFDVEDIEPYPDSKYHPKYTDYSKLDKKYDAIISSFVLNVLPQDQRDALVVKMGELLNDGGRMFVNVRSNDVNQLAKNPNNIQLGEMEFIETSRGSYQKGFKKPELVAYLRDALGDGFTVEPTSLQSNVAAIVTKKGGAQFSLADPETDAEYLKAVNAYDTIKARRMVREAARAAGYNSPLLYHGTLSFGFTKFRASKSYYRTAVFATDDIDTVRTYSYKDKAREIKDRTMEDRRGNYQLYGNTDGFLEVDGRGAVWNDIDFEPLRGEDGAKSNTNQIVAYAKKNGYKGVIIRSIWDDGGAPGARQKKPSDVYAFFDPGSQLKSADPVTYDNDGNVIPLSERFKAENKDVRFSLSQDSEGRQLSETEVQATNETLHDVGVQYDADSETVSYSLSSLEEAFAYNRDEEEYRAAREEYVTALAKATGKSTAEANRYLDSLFLVHDMIAADRDRLDYEAAVDRSAWVSNAEYGGSIDFSTLCAKRRLFTGTFDAIQQKLPDTVLNENDFLRIRNLLLEKGLESPCSMCYVEGSRAKHGVYVKKFLDDYLKTDPAWKPQIADFTSTTRLEQTRIQHPEAYKAYTQAMNALSQRKPKEASVRTDYKGEILEAFKNDTTVAEKNKNGGVRFNSFSDFEIIHALDAMQVLTDMSRVGLNGQAYTKVKEFAEAFGNTGLKINLSLVAKGVDADGKLIMDETNGMNYAEALDIRRRYSENVGTVIVVFNDAQLKAALADNTIDYVLPFHRSQWKKSQYTMMGLPTETRDYTNIQNDRYKNPTTGRAKKAPDGNIMPNEYWDFNLSGRENAQKYLDYINEHGYIPKFDHVLNKVDGKWVLPDGAVGDGYYKLLIDFKMYDNDGWGSPQRPVLPEFNMPYIQRMLDDYVGGHQAFPVAHDVVDAFVAEKTGKRSLSAANEAPTGRGTAARELRYQGEDIAPVAETADQFADADNMVQADDVAPIPGEHSEIDRLNAEYEAARAEFDGLSTQVQEMYSDLTPEEQEQAMEAVLAAGERLKSAHDALNAAQQDILASYTDADVPPEMDAPYYGDEQQTMPDDPMADRDEDTVGKRSVKAYQYLNPEVKPYFRAEAEAMIGDLRRATRGERMVTWDTAGNEGHWTGQKRVLQNDLAGLKDQYGYSYEQLEKGIQAIIDDEGAENNAVSKRIELLIHDRLANGYVDAYSGVEIPANTEYLDFLREKQITEYNDAAFDALVADGDAYAPPIAEDIAPVAEAPVETVAEAPTADDLAGVSSAVDTEVDVLEIKSTYDKILAKKQNAEATLEAHKTERAARAELYQKRIDELQRKLDGKKRKDTKAAVKLAQQITRVRELAANVDADYAKRISDAEKRIARRDFELNQDHTEADKLERAYAKIDAQLAEDRAAVEAEFAQRREELSAAIADKNDYISSRAMELYRELSGLKKGVRASYELGYLLDHGYDWRTLKSTLLKVNLQPDAVINPESAEESVIREMLEEEYASKTFELDELDGEMQDRFAQLEADAEKQKAEVRKSEQQLRRSQLHANLVDGLKNDFAVHGYDLDMVLKDANNLSTFATVDNTPQRVMEKALGYKQGQILADMTVNKTAQNESEGIRWLNQYTDPKNGLIAQISRQYHIKPGSKESAAAQMYAEGFYVNKYNEIIAYGDRELAADFPDVKTQAMIKGLAHDGRIRAIYDETLDAINASRVRNAYPEIPKRKDYFLHFRAMEDTFSTLGLPFNPNDIRAKDLPTDLNGVTADLKPGQPYFASAKQRRGKRTSFDLLGGLEKYLSSAKNQIYHIDDIQTLRALRNYIADDYGQAKGLDSLDALSEEEVQERIKDVFGSHLSTFAKFLNEQANVLAGKTALIDRGLEGMVGRRAITFLNDLNRQVGANMVGYNISSSLTNFIAPVQAFSKMNKAAFVKGFAQTVSNRIGGIFGRGDNFAADSSVMVRREGEKRFHRTAWQRMSDPGYLLMGAVDSLSTEIITRGKVNELMKNGMEYGQALYEADKWVSRLMGDRSLGQQPQLYNSKMLGLITKFQLEVRNQLDSQFYDTIKEAEVSTETIENAKKRNAVKAAKIASTFATLAVSQHIFGQVFESIAGYNPAFDIIEAIAKAVGWDDDEDDDDTVLDNLTQGLLSLAEDMPYYSILSGGRIPIESALPIETLIKGKDSYGNEVSRWKTALEAAPYYVLPGGYGQIKKTAAGLGMYLGDHPVAGSYTDSGNMRFPVGTSPSDVAQAAVFGQYSSGNARDYFDNERKPLSEKQVDEYAAADMTIQEYWDYRDGLKEHDKLADQAEYINSLDIPTWKKNLFINNLTDRKEAIDMADYGQYGSLAEMDFAKKSPEKYKLLQDEGVSYEQFTAFDDKKKNAYSWAAENPEKYSFVRDIGYSLDDYARATDTEKDAFTWAYNNPEKYLVSRAVSDDLFVYRGYTDALNDIKADKDADGKSISGSRKEKVVDYINGLDADYGAKIILLKSEYPSEDDYNYDIIDYLNEREDISAEEMTVILTQLGFKVSADGTITWD